MDAFTTRRVAVAVPCDPRTVQKFLRGDRVTPAIALRIERVLTELGLGAEAPSATVAGLAAFRGGLGGGPWA